MRYVFVVVLGIAIAACEPPEPGEVLATGKRRDTAPLVSADELSSVAAGERSFAFQLFAQLRTEPGNLFFSPFSISSALLLTYAGARGDTAAQMATALSLPPLAEGRIHPARNALDLAVDEGSDQLETANAVFGQTGHPFEQAYVDLLTEQYGTPMRTVDYVKEAEAVRARIDDWVEAKTAGRIVDLLVPGSITPDTRLTLVNAIYFKAAWADRFDAGQTRPAVFHLPDGTGASVPTMSATFELRGAGGDGWSAVELPYTGGRYAMVILLPDAGRFAEVEALLDATFYEGVVAALGEKSEVHLSLPRFTTHGKFSLEAPLEALGMVDAFLPGAADFSGMDGTRDLAISTAVHQAFVLVNEEGTEAAAATAIGVGTTSLPPELHVDRPFFFFIRERSTDTVLFAGRIVDPR